MLKMNRSITITGQSFVEVTTEDGQKTQKQVAYMNATIPENGEISVNKLISNRNLFKENQDIVFSDFNEFENIAYDLE